MAERSKGENPREEELEAQGDDESFEKKKGEFFIKTGLRVRDAFKMHKKAGLWDRDIESNRSWGRVSEHCLVEAARAEVFADKLGLPEDLKNDLLLAAALHDFYKRREIEIYNTEGMTWSSYEKAEKQASDFLTQEGFNERIIKLVDSIGMIALGDIKNILEKKELSQDDIAVLVLHYIDDYTSRSEWAEPTKVGESGEKIYGLDERLNAAAKRYPQLGEEGGRKFFNGESAFAVEIKTAHLIERRITDILNQKDSGNIIPEDLPYLIDQEIKAKIVS